MGNPSCLSVIHFWTIEELGFNLVPLVFFVFLVFFRRVF